MVNRHKLLAGMLLVAASPAWADCADMLPNAAEASAPHRLLEASDLIELRDIGMPDPSYFFLPSPLALSPDGRSIALVLSRGDLATNGYCRALVVIAARGEAAPRIVDRGGEMITAIDVKRGLFVNTGFPDLVVPAWSPDGRWIAYLKRVDGVTQLWRARADGSGAAAITRSAVDVERWAWAPNGRDLLYASRPGIAEARRALDREAMSGYLYDARVRPNPGPRPQLREADVPQIVFLVDPERGETRAATAGEAAALPPDPPGGSQAEAVAMSRDGQRAWTEREDAGPLSPLRIWVADRTGRKQPCAAAACRDGIVNLWWQADGSLLFLRREGWAKGRMALYRWRPGSHTVRRLLASPAWLTGCTWRDAQLYCVAEDSVTPRRVVAIDPASGRQSLLFDPNPGFARLRLGKVQRLTWQSEPGMPAWGDLVLPPDAVPGEKLPLVIVQYHSDGFLRGGTGDAHPIFLLAAHGFAVLSFERPAVESTAYPGLKTIDAIIAAMTKDWGERRSVLASLLAGVDRTIALGVADPARIGITGLSDGASTVNYALINSDRFAAAVVSTCCEDPKTVMTYGGTAWADWNRAVRRYPLASEDGTAFWKPMALSLNADRIKTPLLMQLADSEYLLALEAFTALREKRKPVEMHVAPGEYHTRTQPLHRLAEYQRDVDWFGFWLQGREDPDPAKRAQYLRWRALRDASPSASAAPAAQR
jgi:dipeptidyl aminopeptidase/acylaminoacyl peptidase